MGATQFPVFTVGHSNHSPQAFIALLRQHGIDEVVDVRSTPYSRYAPHFSHESIGRMLEKAGIGYSFMGGELGGRPADSSCYDPDGRVRYDLVADTEPYEDGLRRIIFNADNRRLALVCTEKDPLDCHRALLVADTLARREVDVNHILADGGLESHDAAMDRLMGMLKLPINGDMFRARAEVISEALDRQARKIAYVGPKMTDGGDPWGETR